MKRLLIPLMIIISVLPLNAKSGFKTKGQEIYATIDTHYIMQIEEISYNGGNGIDLNIERSGNNQRNLIAPTVQPCTLPGLKVGTFSLVSSSSDYVLEVFHNKLVNTTTGDEFDYELALSYVLSGNNYTKICLGTDATQDQILSDSIVNPTIPRITMDLRSGDSIVVIQGAGVFFRMREVVNIEGTYLSTVTFLLESVT